MASKNSQIIIIWLSDLFYFFHFISTDLAKQVNFAFIYIQAEKKSVKLVRIQDCFWYDAKIQKEKIYLFIYSNMTSFIGYVNNPMIKLTIYFNSLKRIYEQITNIIPSEFMDSYRIVLWSYWFFPMWWHFEFSNSNKSNAHKVVK
jgi:hypothetical protein